MTINKKIITLNHVIIRIKHKYVKPYNCFKIIRVW